MPYTRTISTLLLLAAFALAQGIGPEQVDFNKMITMNDSAAYLWQGVEGKDFTVEDLTELLTDKYDVAEEKAASDAAKIAAKWIEAGLVEE